MQVIELIDKLDRLPEDAEIVLNIAGQEHLDFDLVYEEDLDRLVIRAPRPTR
jgi:hypothetical protein